jgi:hypothetical protein
MTTSLQALAAQPIPSYCTSSHGVLTPQQWSYCAHLGWAQPTTTAGGVGTYVGSHAFPAAILAILAVVAVLWLLSLGKRLGTASS